MRILYHSMFFVEVVALLTALVIVLRWPQKRGKYLLCGVIVLALLNPIMHDLRMLLAVHYNIHVRESISRALFRTSSIARWGISLLLCSYAIVVKRDLRAALSGTTTERHDSYEHRPTSTKGKGATIREDQISSAGYGELQKVSNFITVRRILNRAGIGSIIFGVIAIIMGIGLYDGNPLNEILGLIGLFLVVEGIWIITVPKSIGLVVDGFALFVVGTWNILITIANASGGIGSHFFAYLGIWQIAWGIQSIIRYKRFSTIPIDKPSDESVKHLNNLVNTIRSAKPEEEPDIVEFEAKNFPNERMWKGKLAQGWAVFIARGGSDVVFTAKKDVEFVKTGKALLGKTLKASFKLGTWKMQGSISPELFDRFQAWKTED